MWFGEGGRDEEKAADTQQGSLPLYKLPPTYTVWNAQSEIKGERKAERKDGYCITRGTECLNCWDLPIPRNTLKRWVKPVCAYLFICLFVCRVGNHTVIVLLYSLAPLPWEYNSTTCPFPIYWKQTETKAPHTENTNAEFLSLSPLLWLPGWHTALKCWGHWVLFCIYCNVSALRMVKKSFSESGGRRLSLSNPHCVTCH